MKLSLGKLSIASRKGLALIIVITTISLISVLVVAIFSVTRTEFKATQSYVAARSAKQLGDMSVAIVQAQVQNAQPSLTDGSKRAAQTVHATQPGMVRVYETNGIFRAAYKLYSSGQMMVTGSEESLYGAAHVAPSDWARKPARFVDLNEPVIRPGRPVGAGSNTTSGYAVYFPVIDPRAAWNYGIGGQSAGTSGQVGTTQVEGFSYLEKAQGAGSGSGVDYSQQVVTPTEVSDPNGLRLPMPVEWIYVLQDGSMGVLDNSNTFVVTGGGAAPSETNPIVGRIAFWTDDESCKININTAAEPTFTGTPFYFHDRDAKWAHFPPVTGEYQRYPGHPATVALSAVLAPNYKLDPWLPNQDGFSSFMDVVNFKEKIYAFSPKIAGGGSESGTKPFVQDDMSAQNGEREASQSIKLTDAYKERLYASVDEMVFVDPLTIMPDGSSAGVGATGSRARTVLSLPNGKNFFDNATLERSRFFLTAHSRSPEFSIHGLPRICMWPIADESNRDTTKFRTSFDNAIALCATLGTGGGSGARSYFFRRYNPTNSSADVNISRNGQLLDYLSDQMSTLVWPATSFGSSSSNANFQAKYGTDNVNQLAVQFFDYIRCTNLYDGILARNNDAWAANGRGVQALYLFRDSNAEQRYTYSMQRISEPPNTIDNVTQEKGQQTNAGFQRASAEGYLPGHGVVSPAMWQRSGRSYKGMGRMFTISEIGFQFMCTADGFNDGNSLSTFPGAADYGRGGATSPYFDHGASNAAVKSQKGYAGFNVVQDVDGVYWSNFPPLLSDADVQKAIEYYGCKVGKNAQPEYHPSRHPGFAPSNWNMTLAAGTPLQTNQKRIQVMMLLETFCPSVGWTGMYPEWTIVLDGDTIAQMTLDGQRLFDTTGDVPIKSFNNIYRTDNNHPTGGHATPTAIAGGRHTRTISNGGGLVTMPADPLYDSNNPSGHNALQNYTLVSDFVTVDRNNLMQVQFPSGDIKIRIYDTHNWETAQPVQTLWVNFASAPSSVPTPDLPSSRAYRETVNQFGRITASRVLSGPHYWCANHEGAIGRMTGAVNPNYGVLDGEPFWRTPPQRAVANPNADVAGNQGGQALRGRLDTQSALFGDQRQGVTWTAVSVTVPDRTTDVIRTMVPTMGDYRVLAALKEVPSYMWQPHPLWTSGNDFLRQAHSFTGHWGNAEPGAKLAETPSGDGNTYNYQPNLQMVGGVRYDIDSLGRQTNVLSGHQPDLPPSDDYATAANAFGDFDTGISNCREGPYINKPDEGNYFAGNELRNNQTKFWRSSYFYETYQNAEDWRSGIYMTPNRMISSPVMFGSLPTGVWGNPNGMPGALDNTSVGGQDYAPWQTLLYRPHANINSISPNSNSSHPGLQDPHDHYTLEMFFMPVVEPYAISEPLSVAGRVNMNYQIMPFTNIRRATGMHGVMKGEFITAVPNNQLIAAKNFYPNQAAWSDRFWDDAGDKRYWHRQIDVAATLRQFDLKFSHQSGGPDNYQGLFRSASQICEMHLVPRAIPGGDGIFNPDGVEQAPSQSIINDIMNRFWANNRATGDNVRERTYSNLYARLTTRSNTFRVHMRAQVIKKARSVAVNKVEADKDVVLSEYRGSTLLERYIDPNDSSVIPDYASEGISNQYPLDVYYRFRTLETKRFSP